MKQHWQVVDAALFVSSDTPEQLWINAKNYFKWCDENPIEHKFTPRQGKNAGQECVDKKPRIYSIKGLCLHCGFDEEYLRDVRASKKRDSEYFIVISKIIYIIYLNNLELTAVDVLNPIFMSKVLNIDKEEVPTSAIKIIVENATPELSTSEAQVLERLEQEFENPESIKLESIKEQSINIQESNLPTEE